MEKNKAKGQTVMEQVLFYKEGGLTEKVTFEQRPEAGRSFGDSREVSHAEGRAGAKALREEEQEASVAGEQPAAVERSEIRSDRELGRRGES